MDEQPSRKKSQGRPALSPIEKQRRLVARLFENCVDLDRRLNEDSGHETAGEDDSVLLMSTFNQRLAFAREVAQLENEDRPDEAKAVRQKLNLFRPLGFTEELWNSMPDSEKRLPPGKPKMPKELELARLEIERDEELEKLRGMEAEYGEEPADIEALRAMHGNTQIGRPGKDILGALDRQLHTAFYKRRDLAHCDVQQQTTGMGRPRKSYKERYDYFTSTINHCRRQIADGESQLNLIDLQLRLLKRLRDRANRTRLRINAAKGPDLVPTLVTLNKDLIVVEDQIKTETDIFNDFQDNYITMSDSQIESRRNSVVKKIKAIDSLEFSDDEP
ncbi:TPA: hypothetical protein P8N89_005830 [Pseudomonas aeruginosa]|uniref:hypothetical protein n=1 Tax=Pseudomonas aeruginosa TaxID=287 RepID=UPI0021F14902|nr:hypothetical protein [Pseudomonas aeruginosa]MCV6102415.1 hypothetical protein [Pseudomonas aeruginosa]MDI2201045.1 hypothetical protein [Pseudomonas aeruginosa]MDY1162146.1 hypothetical protein [Pseudomonas aeruginosa]HBO3960378.1 hypothetical protein [Pseudomonas aeruginosa]HBO4604091.1 hypothetical protein [Pseudomonas aeruginosa]